MEVKPWQDPPQQLVWVNGKEEDLAYVFIHKSLGDSHYLNLAVLSKCPAESISREIDLEKLRKAAAPKPVQVPSPVGRPYP